MSFEVYCRLSQDIVRSIDRLTAMTAGLPNTQEVARAWLVRFGAELERDISDLSLEAQTTISSLETFQ